MLTANSAARLSRMGILRASVKAAIKEAKAELREDERKKRKEAQQKKNLPQGQNTQVTSSATQEDVVLQAVDPTRRDIWTLSGKNADRTEEKLVKPDACGKYEGMREVVANPKGIYADMLSKKPFG